MKPVLLVVAGPNGSGKTTITEQLRRESWSDDTEYLNPDDVARERFGDWNSPQAVLDAARWVEARREQLLAEGKGIAFETVFSSPGKLDFVARARAAGYFVRLFFVGTSSPTINGARVTARVLAGGHSVPIEKIISRYAKSMSNLALALELADRVYVYDNSVDAQDASLCARAVNGSLRKVYRELPQWVEQAFSALPRAEDCVDARRDGVP